jgi:hypothetical protein
MAKAKLLIAPFVISLILGAWLYIKYQEHEQSYARCEKVGGVYVESYSGAICINPRALLQF